MTERFGNTVCCPRTFELRSNLDTKLPEIDDVELLDLNTKLPPFNKEDYED